MIPRVELWYARTETAFATAPVFALLTPEERARHDRFHFERHRREYLVTRGVERAMLAHALARPPHELRFGRTDLGRPFLVDGGEFVFSLTNSVRMVVGVVAHGREVGVDAEPLDRGAEVVGLATAVFTPAERAMLVTLVEKERRAVELWTAKEAYMKARGLGLTLAPETIEFDIDDKPANLRIAPAHDARPGRWKFVTGELDDHVFTVCVEAVEAVDIAVHAVDLNVLDRAAESR